jgi:hypothetical protein
MLRVRQKSFLVQAECALKNISRMLSVRKNFWAHTQHVLKSLNVLLLDLHFFAQHEQIKNFFQKNFDVKGKI